MEGVFFREQAHALQRAGHQVGVIAPIRLYLPHIHELLVHRPGEITTENDGEIFTLRGYGWKWLSLVPHGEASLFRASGKRLLQAYVSKHGKPDLIQAHSALYAGVLAEELLKDQDIPYVITEHSSAFALKKPAAWKIGLARQAFAKAAARIVVSPGLGQLLESMMGETFVPWKWIPNMVNPDFLHSEIRPKPAGRAGTLVFLNIATLVPNKGQADLLEAFSQQFRGQPGVELRIGGAGPLRSSLEEQARQLGISQQVHFLGYLNREQVLAEMQQADVFVLSSHYETFGLVLVEALACGKPVIATACGGPQAIVDQENGLLVPVHEPAKMGKALLLMKDQFRSFNPAAIRADCQAHFGEQAVVEQLTKVYESVLQKK